MNRAKSILVAAFAVYLTALGVAWRVVSKHAYDQTVKLLVQSEVVFIESVGDYLDSILLHASKLILRDLGGGTKPVSNERMRQLAEQYQVDEINLVGTNGVCHSSTEKYIVDYDYRETPETAAYFKLLRDEMFIAERFRRSKSNPEVYRKYTGFPLPDRSGFIQLGMDFSRARKTMLFFSRPSLLAWKIGRTGFYDFYDADGDGLCDYTRKTEKPGEVTKVSDSNEHYFMRSFDYAGGSFLSLLGEREYFSERNLNFSIMAPTLAGIVIFLTWLVFSMSRAHKREREHRAAEDANRARDLDLAKAIQLSALPSFEVFRRDFFAFSVAAKTLPAKEVGGDFYDFYFVGDSRIALVIADASGKGIPAAMFMMRAKNEIENALGSEPDLAEAVRNANERLCAHNEVEMFVTAFIGVIDIRTGLVEYVNAGHNRPFVRRVTGEVEKIVGKGGPFLGMFPEAKFRVNSFKFQPDDAFFLFTDGITEAMNGARELYGEARLKAELETAKVEESPERLVEQIGTSVHTFAAGAEQSDDLTALALVWHGEKHRHERTFASERAVLGPAMDWLRASLKLTDGKKTARLLNAADEVMVNIIDYSGSENFSITVENAPGRVRLNFVDTGKAYNPLTHTAPDTHLKLEDRPDGGLGILMVKQLVDSIFYRREQNQNMLALIIT